MVNPGSGCIVHRNVKNRYSGNDAPHRALHGNGFWSQGINWCNSANALHADIMAVAYYKRIADWKTVAKLLPTALLGFLVALFVDKLVPAQGFRQLMGWTLALAMAVMIWSEIFGKESRWMHKWLFCPLRSARRFHHDDWQCCRTSNVCLSALDAQGEDGIYRH